MKNVTDFEDLLKEKYGEKGTPSRDKFDADSLAGTHNSTRTSGQDRNQEKLYFTD